MKKLFLSIGCAAILGMGIFAISCKKEDSDFDKGKKDGQAYCDCVNDATAASMDCMDKISYTGSAEYQKGFTEGAKSCWEY